MKYENEHVIIITENNPTITVIINKHTNQKVVIQGYKHSTDIRCDNTILIINK